jgi:hypothetical protein
LALTLGACGTDKKETVEETTETAVRIEVSGTFSPHPVSAGFNLAAQQAGAAALSYGAQGDITLQLVDPVDVIANPTGFEPLAEQKLDVTKCAANDKTVFACAFVFADVDISGLSLGLVALAIDGRATSEFVRTNTGLFGSSGLGELLQSGGDKTDAKVFAVSSASLSVAAFTGKSEAALLADGFLFGMTLSANATPVGGTTLTAGDTSQLGIVYPNDTYNGVSTATNSAGFFIGVGNPATGAAAVNTSLEAAGGGKTWAKLPAVGTTKGTAFVLMYLADD